LDPATTAARASVAVQEFVFGEGAS